MRRISKDGSGYKVRISFGKKCLISEWFGKAEYGSMPKALKAAKAHRDQLEKEYDLKTDLWNPVTGVSRVIRYMDDRIDPACSYRSSWREGAEDARKSKSRQFHFKYGDRDGEMKAKQLAINHRKEMERLHYSS